MLIGLVTDTMLHDRASRTQWLIVFTAIVVFVVLAVSPPGMTSVLLLSSAAVMWSIIAYVARRLGPAALPSWREPMHVGVLAVCGVGATLVVLAAVAEDHSVLRAGPLLLLQLLVAQAVWALLRYPVERPKRQGRRSVRKDALWGLALGGIGAGTYSAIALILYVLSAREPGVEAPAGPRLSAMVAAYFAGLLSAGLLAGILRPLARWPLGAMGLGILGGWFAYTAIGIAVDGFPVTPEIVVYGLIGGVMGGPLIGLALYVDPPTFRS